RGTKSLPDMAAISSRLDSLYGARIRPLVRKKGEIHAIGFFADFADDSFIPEKSSNLEDMAALLGEMLLNPAKSGSFLREDYIESEKEKLLDLIRGRINDKRAYSMQRLLEQMCAMENYGTDPLGSETEVESITAAELTRHLNSLLSDSPMEIFYCGSAPAHQVKACVTSAFSGLSRNDTEPDLGTDIRMNPLEEKPRYFEDRLQVTQGKLALGFRLGDCMEEPNAAAIRVFNAIYGGSVTSKLFMNVREKLSLCYFASSSIDLHKGVMAVSSGIEFSKYDDALAEILTQLEEIKKGNISDYELTAAKRYIASDYRAFEDSPNALEDYYLNQALIGPDFTPLEMADLAEKVTVAQVVDIAKGIELDAIYFLRGKEES
ncbi:MAG: insulinase family protein, partial [Clostridiales bacterium]|nr:insulinase family protein [Clostridiales bacterium]